MSAVWCATGHRPNKLGGYDDDAFRRLVRVASVVLSEASSDLQIISGMALGWDQAWLTAALDLGIPSHAAVPFAGQESAWPGQSQAAYRSLLSRCASVTVVSDGAYSAAKMQIRNEWMVDRSSCVIALWDGTNGGTANCIRYAQKRGSLIYNCYPLYRSLP